MVHKNIIVLRGASGSGKSSVAALFSKHVGVVTVCADDFFTRTDGTYHFDAALLGRAHEDCHWRFEQALKESTVETIVVANTNTSERDFRFYEDLAKKHNATVFHLVVENRHGNSDVHNVPDEVKEKQKQRILSNIKL